MTESEKQHLVDQGVPSRSELIMELMHIVALGAVRIGVPTLKLVSGFAKLVLDVLNELNSQYQS